MPVVRKLSTSLSLPSAPNKPSEEFTDYCSFIYGRKQWGKSTLASQYPNSINFQFEPFRKGLNIVQVSPKSHEETIQYIELFYESEFSTCIFDTIDRFYDNFLKWKCQDLSNGTKTHPGEFGNEGYAIWDLVKNDFERIFEVIREAGKTFVCVSHDKEVRKKDRDGQEWIRTEPTCKPAAWKIGQSMCDFVFHVDFLNGDRIVTVRDLDNSTLASCNPDIDCFLDPDGKPIRRFKVPNDKKAPFQTVMDAFHNKLHDASYEPPRPKLQPKANGSLLAKKK